MGLVVGHSKMSSGKILAAWTKKSNVPNFLSDEPTSHPGLTYQCQSSLEHCIAPHCWSDSIWSQAHYCNETSRPTPYGWLVMPRLVRRIRDKWSGALYTLLPVSLCFHRHWILAFLRVQPSTIKWQETELQWLILWCYLPFHHFIRSTDLKSDDISLFKTPYITVCSA